MIVLRKTRRFAVLDICNEEENNNKNNNKNKNNVKINGNIIHSNEMISLPCPIEIYDLLLHKQRGLTSMMERKAYRVHCGCPDSQPWPSPKGNEASPRQKWLQAMCLCRHICDEALSLTLKHHPHRPGSGSKSWRRPPSQQTKLPYSYKPEHQLPNRNGDYSVMYAMHYFNDHPSLLARTSGTVTGTTHPNINVKPHVDPSLFVLEPFLSHVEGLQILPSSAHQHQQQQQQQQQMNDMDTKWISCDGPHSPIAHQLDIKQQFAMIMFVGRAFVLNCPKDKLVKPTLHRVIAPSYSSSSEQRTKSHCCRRAVIYEQKYEEYFPPPILD